jgi:hypothetical protein
MSFDARVLAFAERFLSDRTFRLIVAPALADLQFERGTGAPRRVANRLAVLRALAGGLGDDLARGSGSFVGLMLLPASYYIFLLLICFDFFSISISTSFLAVALLILALSFAPVMACFWPARPTVRHLE